MRTELQDKRLEVILIPADEPKHRGHCIRAVASLNPLWYMKFCGTLEARRGRRGSRRRMYGRRNKYDTGIKRANTLRALDELLQGYCYSLYAGRLLDFIRG